MYTVLVLRVLSFVHYSDIQQSARTIASSSNHHLHVHARKRGGGIIMTQPTYHAEHHATFELYDICCLECAGAVVQALRAQEHISSVHLDWAHNRVHLIYHGGMIPPA